MKSEIIFDKTRFDKHKKEIEGLIGFDYKMKEGDTFVISGDIKNSRFRALKIALGESIKKMEVEILEC